MGIVLFAALFLLCLKIKVVTEKIVISDSKEMSCFGIWQV